jgi:glycosyltransferase involved in cell wall biosynthesis
MTNRLRILWVCHRDIRNPKAGGAERTTIEIGKRLVKHGHDVRVLSSGWPGAPSHDSIEGVSIHRYASTWLPHVVLPIEVRFKDTLDLVIDDLAHVVPWGTPRLCQTPVVAFFRHMHSRTLPGQVPRLAVAPLSAVERLYRRIYADCVFVTESLQAVRDLTALGISRANIRQIHPGVDHEVFYPRNRSKIPQVVYFAGIKSYKRPDHALKAFQKVLKEKIEARLVVVGSGSGLGLLRDLASKLGVSRSVTFSGRLSELGVAEIVGSSWANLHCAVAEGWGYSILEAAASGTPTIAYATPGVSESVADGISGVLVPDGNVDELADAIRGVLSSRKDWRFSSSDFASGFSWEKAANEWEDMLQSVCSHQNF